MITPFVEGRFTFYGQKGVDWYICRPLFGDQYPQELALKGSVLGVVRVSKIPYFLRKIEAKPPVRTLGQGLMICQIIAQNNKSNAK